MSTTSVSVLEPITTTDATESAIRDAAISVTGQIDRTACLVLADYLAEHGQSDEMAYRILGLSRYGADRDGTDKAFGFPTNTIYRLGRDDFPTTRLRLDADGQPVVFYNQTATARPETDLEMARRQVAWVGTHRAALDKMASAIRREQDLLARAAAGDVAALLAHPESRRALTSLALGQKVWRGRLATSYTSSRKAIAEAKAILRARQQRQADRKTAESASQQQPGRIARLAAAKVAAKAARKLAKARARALELAIAYHRSEVRLYQSQYATVLYGHGGQETVDDSRYSKGWHRQHGPARCLNGGVRLDSEDRPRVAILENFRGTVVARLRLSDGKAL